MTRKGIKKPDRMVYSHLQFQGCRVHSFIVLSDLSSWLKNHNPESPLSPSATDLDPIEWSRLLSLTVKIATAERDWRNSFRAEGFSLSPAEADENSGTGFLFERYVGWIAQHMGVSSVCLNLVLRNQKIIAHEYDVVGLAGDQVVIVDCKSGANIKFLERLKKLTLANQTIGGGDDSKVELVMASSQKQAEQTQLAFLENAGIAAVVDKGNFHELPGVLRSLALNSEGAENPEIEQKCTDLTQCLQRHWDYPFLHRIPGIPDPQKIRAELVRGYNYNIQSKDACAWASVRSGNHAYLRLKVNSGFRIHQFYDLGYWEKRENLQGEDRDVWVFACEMSNTVWQQFRERLFSFKTTQRTPDSLGKPPRLAREVSRVSTRTERHRPRMFHHADPSIPAKPTVKGPKPFPAVEEQATLLLLDEQRKIGKLMLADGRESAIMCFPRVFETGDRVIASFPDGNLEKRPLEMRVENEDWSYGRIISWRNGNRFCSVLSHHPVIRELIPASTRALKSIQPHFRPDETLGIPIPVRFRLSKHCFPIGRRPPDFHVIAEHVEPVGERSPDFWKTQQAVFGRLAQFQARVLSGYVKTYLQDRQFGFVRVDNEDVFFHGSVFQSSTGRTPDIGDAVEFVVDEGNKGLEVKRFFGIGEAALWWALKSGPTILFCRQSALTDFLQSRADRVYFGFPMRNGEIVAVTEADPGNLAHCIAVEKNEQLEEHQKIIYRETLLSADLNLKKLDRNTILPKYLENLRRNIEILLQHNLHKKAFEYECKLQTWTHEPTRLGRYRALHEQTLSLLLDIPAVATRNTPPEPCNWALEFEERACATEAAPSPVWALDFSDAENEPMESVPTSSLKLNWDLQFEDSSQS